MWDVSKLNDTLRAFLRKNRSQILYLSDWISGFLDFWISGPMATLESFRRTIGARLCEYRLHLNGMVRDQPPWGV